MADQIKITIATPVFNGADTLRAALDSVMNQTHKHIEYVVVDGGSTDGTQDIVKEYSKKYPGTIIFLSEPDKGIYDAMNKARKLAAGDFLLFLGSDDILYNETVLSTFVAEITDKRKVYYGDVLSSVSREIWYGPYTTEKLSLQNISHQAIFYPKQIYQTYEYSLKYKLFSDWEYNIRVWGQEGVFTRLNLIISVYCENGASISQDEMFFADRKKLVKQYFGDKYAKLVTLQKIKQKLIGNTDLRKIKGYIFPKVK